MRKLVWLNSGNPTGLIQAMTLKNLTEKFPDEELIGLEIGSAYGGAVEQAAKLWKGRGKVYGYDTFMGHPKDLAVSPDDMEAWCMDSWYDPRAFGTENLSYHYQRKVLDENGLDNAILVKGRIDEKSFDNIEKAHFVMIDLDMIGPTTVAYNAIKDKIPVGGYLFMHDALPAHHLPRIHDFVYNKVLAEGRWKIMFESDKGNLTGLERWVNVNGKLNEKTFSLNGEL